ncbi:TonB-dependent receptor [Methylomonas sp. LW13]|uniref:TonB-dependent siderophore receptor n=1 Tax=unclassified Methylomonas TaxID=2608980 RepID=UPI00051C8D65|nr:TonB-dependent receptor [Methylomonas sp. LW13]QBC27305.1 TonB-dependent receptor [Methylomonas sp. LW13]
MHRLPPIPPAALRKLAMAIALALPAIRPLPVYAAETGQTDTPGATRTFNIPAQALTDALNAFIAASDWQVGFPAEIAQNARSSAVNGHFSPQQALDNLLQGTGIGYRLTGPGNVMLEKKAITEPQSAATLPPVTVTGKVSYVDDDPQNPFYNRTIASSATKTDTPIMDTPLSIQVIPKAVLDDQQAIRVGDALRNVSGYFDSRGEEYVYDTAYLRGFATDSRQYIDGLRDLPQSHSLAMIDRVEVLKGPAGALYGRMEPGGLINYVTKRPLDTPYYSLQQQFGSFDLYRTLADASGPINKDGSLLYRVNMEYLSSNSYIDVVNKERGFIAPSLAWKISPRTQLDLDFRYHDVNGPTTFGVPAVGTRPANLPISRFIGERATDNGDSSLLYGGLSLTHAFFDNWKLNAKVGYNYEHQFSAGTFINTLDEATGDASLFYSDYDYNEDSIQGIINLTGNFNTFGLEHTLTVGGDLYKTDGRTNSSYFLCDTCGTSFPAPINIFQPITYDRPGINLAAEASSPVSTSRTSWWGLYIQDQVTIAEDWHLLFGTRYDQAHSSSDGADVTDDGEFSPRVGLLYRPLNWLSLYANYVKAMNAANTSRLIPGSQRRPEMSEGWEAGVKGEWWEGKLNAGLTYYELTKKNISHSAADAALAAQGFNVLVGEGRSQGIELDVSGRITDFWSLIASYSFTRTMFTKDVTDIQGKQFANVPEQAASLWSKYDFSGLGWQGLWTGAGVYLAGERQGDRANSFQLPGYARVDAALGYAFNAGPSKISLQFNVDNLLDKRYYSASTWETRSFGSQPGMPRTFLGSVKVEF